MRSTLTVVLLTLCLYTFSKAHEVQWPYNLPRTVKYFPEDEPHVKRGFEVAQQLAWRTPAAIKKMGEDPAEKFFLDYWQFSFEDVDFRDACDDEKAEETERSSWFEQFDQRINTSLELVLRPAYMPHISEMDWLSGLQARSIEQRAFQCPSSTTNCSTIGQPGYCCNSGETCVLEGSNVGCCPSGETCGSTIAGCDTGAGYTSCNNGCCIPGSSCTSGGCVVYGTKTVTATLPVVTVTTGTLTTSTSTLTTTITGTIVSTPYTTTVTVGGSTVTQTIISPTTIFVSTTTPTSCASGYFSCPNSLGGGCCPNGQDCATGTHCPNLPSSTITANAPILPTSSSDTSVSAADTSTSGSVCPTGFYQCSAVYLGGCCQIGRNCDTTSCPALTTTTIIAGSGATIATTGPSGSTASILTRGTCASGWGLCPASAGGGCCPSGYLCASNCIATVSGVGNQTKEAPSAAAVHGFTWSFLALGIMAAVGMIIL